MANRLEVVMKPLGRSKSSGLSMQAAVGAFMVSLVGAVDAQVTYSYVGQGFDTLSGALLDGSNPFTSANSITGSFTVDAVLADGVHDFSGDSLAANSISFAMSFSDGFIAAPWVYSNTAAFPVGPAGTAGHPWRFDLVVSGGNITSWALLISGPPALVNPQPPGTFSEGSGGLTSSGGTLAGAYPDVPTGDQTSFAQDFWLQATYTAFGGTAQFGTWLSPVSPIPEPETYAMLLAGLGLLGYGARRRKKLQRGAA